MKRIGQISSVMVAVFVLVWVLSPPAEGDTGALAPRRAPGTAAGQAPGGQPAFEIVVSEPVAPTLSPAARDLPRAEIEFTLDREVNPRLNLNDNPDKPATTGGIPGGGDPLLARQAAAPATPDLNFLTPILNFDAQDYTFVNPPDTVGDVGPNHYVHMVNTGGGTSVVIYDKTGAVLTGPFALDALGSGNCADGLGDPIVLYDQLADRWLLSEFSGSGNQLCVYISQTADPTGSYYAYAFTATNFPDYPKYAVWPDAYYVTSNEASPAAYALDRAQMLAGAAATSQRFTAPDLLGFGFQALTPGDLDGATAPPAGAPGYFMRHRDTEAHGPTGFPTQDFLEVWAFDVDFATPANSSFTQVGNVAVSEFDSDLCGLTSFFCFPQQGSATTLDPLREVVMWRLAYRNFGAYETLVGNLVTDVDGTDHGGIRWFELRKSGAGGWALHQEGTYAPDAHHRWLGSIAMDGSGNIAVGYSVSSSTLYPSIRYAGRLAGDPVGTLPQGEGLIVAGTSSNGSNRWGDYSAMSVDPADDCTFWYTNMYTDGGNWDTRVATFKFDQCGGADFALSATPMDLAVCAPGDAVYTVDVESLEGFTDPVTLSAAGHPAGTTAAFSVNPVTPTGSSTLTIGNTGAAAAGSYSISVVGVAPTSTHTTTVGLNLNAAAPPAVTLLTPANGSSNLPPLPSFTWQPLPGASGYEFEMATDIGFSNVVISATGLLNPTYTPSSPLATSATYYWRVRAANGCGPGSYSAIFRFSTQATAGDCGPGTTPAIQYAEDFESGAGGWSHGGTGDTWTLSTARPHAGTYAYHATNVSSISDQQLDSPAVALPTGQSPVTLQFWNYQAIESNGSTACYDGAVLEISTNGGSSWTRLESELVTDPYDGPISTSFSNPLGGQNAWCGDAQDWLESVVDLDAFAGQNALFRFRLATDSSVSREGWYIDDLVVQSCVPVPYGVDLSPDAAATELPGATVDYTVTLTNTGSQPDTYDLAVGATWPTGLSQPTISVPAGGTASFMVSVTVPPAAPAGGSDVAQVVATSQADPGVDDVTSLTTTAAAVVGVALSPGGAATGAPGATVTHTLTITNTGNAPDIFNLSVMALWTTSLDASSIPLAPGASGTVQVSVAIPAAATAADLATVTAASTNDAGVTAQAQFVTAVDRRRIYLPFTVGP